MPRDAFLDSLWTMIRRHELLKDKDEVVVAVSGGADSVALLRALCWIRDGGRTRLWLCVAHLNHMLRGDEAKEDARFVKRLARRMRCLCFDGAVDVPALASERKLSTEEAAREARYAYLEQVCMAVGARKLALGHTADDQVETVLHRFLRGAGPAGLAGIPLRRPLSEGSPIEIIRPLLGATRPEIEAFLRRRRQTFRVDSSNLHARYFRNRVRHELLPLLEAGYNVNVRAAIAGLAAACGEASDFLNRTAQETFKSLPIARREGLVEVPLSKLRDVPKAVMPLVLRQIFDTMGVGLKHVGREHYLALSDLILKKGGEKRAALPGGLTAMRSGESLRLGREAAAPKGIKEAVPLPVPGSVAVPSAGITISAEIVQGGMKALAAFRPFKGRYEEMLDLDKLALPLCVRGRRFGERFHPLGAKGPQKLQDFMVNRKIPREERAQVPIVADRRHAVWVVGYRMDHRARITPSTRRVLRLTAERY